MTTTAEIIPAPEASQVEPPTPTMPPSAILFARNPEELVESSGKMIAFLDAKISQLEDQEREIEHERQIAIKNHWRAAPWTRQLSILRPRITYYAKIKVAVTAGYLVIPNMPMDLFAVRSDHRMRHRFSADSTNRRAAEALLGKPLALGEGENHSANANTAAYTVPKKNWEGKPILQEDGTPEREKQWYATGYQDIDFPIDVAKPVLMERTARALDMKVFDEVGVARDNSGRKGDPYIVGHIIDPRKNRPGLSFFIGWYLNLATL